METTSARGPTNPVQIHMTFLQHHHYKRQVQPVAIMHVHVHHSTCIYDCITHCTFTYTHVRTCTNVYVHVHVQVTERAWLKQARLPAGVGSGALPWSVCLRGLEM